MRSLVFLLLLSLSCAGLEKRWQVHQYHRSREIIEKATPKSWRERCGYEAEPEPPGIMILEEEAQIAGRYSTRFEIVYYKKSDHTALLHEFIHHRNHKAGGRKKCIEELTAYLAERIDVLEDQNMRLRRARRN